MAGRFSLESILTMHDKATGVMKQMESGATRLSRRMSAAFKGMSRTGAGVTNTFGRMHGMIAGAVGLLTTGMAAKAVADFAARGDDIADMAKRTGWLADRLQEVSYAANAADISSEDFTGMIQKMNNNLGSGGLLASLKKINPQLATQLAHTQDSQTAFMGLMDAIAAETNAQKRAAIAQAAFGKSGQQVIDMAGDLRKKMLEARRSGTMISPADIAAAAQMHTNILKLKASATGFANVILGRVVSVFGPLLEKLTAWVDKNRDFINLKLESTLDAIFKGISDTYNTLRDLNDFMGGKLIRNIFLVVGAWKALRLAIDAAAFAQKAFSLFKVGSAVAGAAGAGAAGAGGAGAIAGGAALAGIASTAAAIAAPAAILGAVYYGASQYAKNATPETLNPNNALLSAATRQRVAAPALGGAQSAAMLSGLMTPALAAALNRQSAPSAPPALGFSNPSTRGAESRTTSETVINKNVKLVVPSPYSLEDETGKPLGLSSDLGEQ